MAESKTYLSVPYAQKDAAKALGARWDAVRKKWYVPMGKDVDLFSQWRSEESNGAGARTETTSRPKVQNKPMTGHSNSHAGPRSGSSGIFTYPTIADFVAYNGDLPPWK